MCHYAQLWNLDGSPLPPQLSTLIWAIFLQIFNIFLLQLFHEENHEILRSWRDQWGPSPDNLGGEKEEDCNQEVGRSQGILGRDSGTIPLSVFNHGNGGEETCILLLVFPSFRRHIPNHPIHSYSSQNGINSSEMHFCTLWCVQVSPACEEE